MSNKSILGLIAFGLGIAACDAAEPQPVERLGVVASEQDGAAAFFALAAADSSEPACTAVVLEDASDVLVVDAERVVGVCEAGASSCFTDDASALACGQSPRAVADFALELADDDGFRDWCPPSEQSCGPGGGYSCIDPVCKNACGKELSACRAACGTNTACRNACAAEASFCFQSCC